MANGIEDLMNIRTMGGTQNVPPRPPMGRPPMGGPPPGQPPMVRPPMGGGIASMSKPPMGGQPPMKQPPMGQPPMGMEEPPMEEPMSIEKDAALLAEATIGRTGGDPQAAVAILDTAKAMLMSSGQEEPMMMKEGGGLNPGLTALAKTNPDVVEQITGKPIPKDLYMGGPLYAQDGMPLSDTEIMKQMIMNSMNDSSNKVLAKDFLQGDDGSNPYSDRDMIDPSVSSISNFNELAKRYGNMNNRTVSDKDISKDELRGIYGKSRIFNM